jgi:hypothetical protein
MLAIPDVRQALDYDCGTAAVDAVCRFFGKRERGPVPLANPIQGMGPQTVEAVLRSRGFRVLSGSMTVRDLKHLTDTGRPVLCPVDLFGGHWVVVSGVARLQVAFHCPTDGPRTLKAAAWLPVWKDRSHDGHQYDQWGICVSG